MSEYYSYPSYSSSSSDSESRANTAPAIFTSVKIEADTAAAEAETCPEHFWRRSPSRKDDDRRSRGESMDVDENAAPASAVLPASLPGRAPQAQAALPAEALLAAEAAEAPE